MGQGLRPYWHQPIVDHVEYDYDYRNDCETEIVTYICIILGCQWKKREISKCYYPPPIKNKTKALERNKKKHGNRK